MNYQTITSKDDLRVDFYRDLNFTPEIHKQNNVFIAEGSKIVKKLLRSKLEVLSVLTDRKHHPQVLEMVENIELPTFDLYLSDKKLIDEIVGFNLHEGILAIGRIPDFISLNQIGDRVVIANGIINSENVGSIIRNTNAFGFDTFILDTKTSSPYLRRAVRVSMGSVFYVDVYSTENLIDDINYLKNKGYMVVSVEQSEKSIKIGHFVPKDKICYIFGTESKGIDQAILELSDYIVEIPIEESSDSLNVASSSAIALFYHNFVTNRF